MKETRWDCVEFTPPELPYSESRSTLDFSPHIYSGYNAYVDHYGEIRKRFGTSTFLGSALTGRVVRMWIYETLPQSAYTPPSPSVFILASVLSGSDYKLYWKYIPVDAEADPGWQSSATDWRNMNTSKKAHLVTFSKGQAYVKCFPDSGQDKYGTVILRGAATGTMSVYPWGVPGPTNAVLLNGDVTKLTSAATATDTTLTVSSTTGFPSPSGTLWIGMEKITYTGTTGTTFTGCTRGASGTKAEAYDIGEAVRNLEFDASDHQVEVKYGWQYAFAYVSVTGQVSNRSDIQRNPDLMPSNTGPFADMNPKMTLTLDSFFYNDTTTYPYLNMYRTTDGGGTFYFLEQVANPGTSTLTYEDDSFGTGASSTTYNDPVPDSKLDTARYAPSLTSNSPPTPVIPPDVMGDDTPSKDCWSMTTFAGRIWIAISNYLFFSSREETRDGIGEECFPSGNLGNFFILDSGIKGLAATDQALYVGTSRDIWKLEGSTLDSFVINKQFADTGVATIDSPMKSFKNRVAFVSNTGVPGLITGDSIKLIGEDVISFGNNYLVALNNGFSIDYYNDPYGNNWLIFFAGKGNSATSVQSSLYIYDLDKSEKYNANFWMPPWRGYWSAVTSGPYSVVSGFPTSSPKLFFSTYNSVAAKSGVQYSELSSGRDYNMSNAGSASSAFIYMTVTFSRVRNPAGNHLNALSIPEKDVNFYGFVVYAQSDSLSTYELPSPSLVLDNKTSSESLTAENIWRTANDDGGEYEMVFYPVNKECRSVRLTLISSTLDKVAVIKGISFMFDPKANP